VQSKAVCESVVWAGQLTSPPQAKNKSKGKTQKSKGKAAAKSLEQVKRQNAEGKSQNVQQ
jgi:hypothetical protein